MKHFYGKNCFLFVLKWPDERSWSWARDKRLHSFTECDDDTWIAKFSKSVECDSHHNFMGTFATFKKPFRFGFVFVLTEAAQCVYFYYLTTLATSINVLKIKSRFCWLANLAVRKTTHNFCKSLRSVNLGPTFITSRHWYAMLPYRTFKIFCIFYEWEYLRCFVFLRFLGQLDLLIQSWDILLAECQLHLSCFCNTKFVIRHKYRN